MKPLRLGSLAALLLLLRPFPAGGEECRKKICKDDYSFDGTFCRSKSGLNLRSPYRPESPVCPAGWDVKGEFCVKTVCCEKPVCKADERYRDGYCWSGPSGIGAYRSHRPASCEPGWELDPERGVCRNPACRPVGAGPAVNDRGEWISNIDRNFTICR
jgi:hypothetical protein